MDINLQLEGRGHAVLTKAEEYALLMHSRWDIKTCADMVVRLREILDASSPDRQ